MPEETTIADSIEQAAKEGVAAHSVDGEATTAMSINDQIAAAKFLGAKKAFRKGMGAALHQQMKAPSSTGE